MPKTLDEWWNDAVTSDDTDIILYSEEEIKYINCIICNNRLTASETRICEKCIHEIGNKKDEK